MKSATVIAVALASFSSFPSPAQQDQQTQQTPSALQQAAPQLQAMLQEPTPAQPQSQSAPAQSQQAPPEQAQPDQQPNVRTVQLQLITGELQDKLDSKSAKQGDSVVLKTKEDVKIPDGTEIPKGSKLVGHVTNVQPRAEGTENSQITLQFDRAELKTGQSLPIESVLESVAPSAGESTAENNNNVTAPVQPGTAGPPNTNAGAAPGATNPNNNQNTANNQPGAASGQTPDQSANTGSPAPGSIVARSGNVAIRTTSIPGVLVANNISGQPFSNAAGMLLGARRDIKLDGGTQMVVAVTAAPQNGGSGMVR